MEEWVSFIRDVGFPMVVAIYLLNRIEIRLDEMITNLAVIQNQTERLFQIEQVNRINKSA